MRSVATDASMEVASAAITEWSRKALPARVAEISQNPYVRD
jgi:hypothetical protein